MHQNAFAGLKQCDLKVLNLEKLYLQNFNALQRSLFVIGHCYRRGVPFEVIPELQVETTPNISSEKTVCLSPKTVRTQICIRVVGG